MGGGLSTRSGLPDWLWLPPKGVGGNFGISCSKAGVSAWDILGIYFCSRQCVCSFQQVAVLPDRLSILTLPQTPWYWPAMGVRGTPTNHVSRAFSNKTSLYACQGAYGH